MASRSLVFYASRLEADILATDAPTEATEPLADHDLKGLTIDCAAAAAPHAP